MAERSPKILATVRYTLPEPTVRLAAARSARQRAYRARKHEGRITLPVEVDDAALAEGEPKYDDLERRLAEAPVIT